MFHTPAALAPRKGPLYWLHRRPSEFQSLSGSSVDVKNPCSRR